MNIWQALRLPPRRLVIWHSVAAVPMGTVVLLGAYLSYHYHGLALENRNRVDRAYEVLDVVDGLFISVQNADVSQRDYIITGDANRLGAFESAVRQQTANAGRLHTLLTGSPEQQANLARLETAVGAKLDELGETITVRRTRGFNAAQEVILRQAKDTSMDDIRRQVGAIGAAERRLLMERQAIGREHERDTLLVGIFIAALSVVTRILIAVGLRHYHARQLKAG